MNDFLSKRTILIVTSIFIVSISIYFISYFIVVKPMKDELAITNETIEMYQEQIDIMKNQSTDQINNKRTVLASIPSTLQPDEILLQIEELTSNSSIKVNYLETINIEKTPNPSELPEGIEKTTFIMEAAASSLKDANTFLTAFKNSNRLFVIDKLTISKTEDNNFSLIITFSAFHTSK